MQNGNEKATKNSAFEGISDATVRRLPRYFRFLRELIARGETKISSAALARMMDVTASQIRQDLNCFGGFGTQGYGYNIRHLYSQIARLLGVEEDYRAVIVGAGNLGRAIVGSPMFERRGVRAVAMFDVDPELIGKTFAGVPIYAFDTLCDYCRENRVDIGVLTLPRDRAHDALAVLCEAGVRGVWNFTSNEFEEAESMAVENVYMGDSLMTLCYKMRVADIASADTEDSDE